MNKSTAGVVLAVLGLTACGSAGTKTADCQKVILSGQGNQTVYGEVVKPTGVDCATAQKVVQEWGRQQVGEADAKLPVGWKCGTPPNGSTQPPCTNGKASVDFVLEYPQNG